MGWPGGATRVGRSLEPFGRDWKGGLDWVRCGPEGCVALPGPPWFSWLKVRGPEFHCWRAELPLEWGHPIH